MSSDIMRQFSLRAREAHRLMAESRQRAASFEVGLERAQNVVRSRDAILGSWHLIAQVNHLLAENR
jgi:hypothetical protein